MAIGSDQDFYGSFMGGFAPNFGMGAFQPWQGRGGGQIGASSFVPQLQSLLPGTAGGFLQQQLPELAGMQGLGGMVSPELQELYGQFRTGDQALEAGGSQKFIQELLGREDVQGLLEKASMQGEGTYVDSAQSAIGLEQFVEQAMGKGGQLQNLYGGLGLESGQVATDLQRFLGGQQSALGGIYKEQLGGQGADITQAAREAVGAQLFGNQMVNIGDRTFNPFSVDILRDNYNLTMGQGSGLEGTNLLRMAGGLLSTQDMDITAGMAGGFQRAQQTGADMNFGGRGGYALTQAVGGLAGQLGEGQSISQGTGDLRGLVDAWYGGQAGRGFGGHMLPQLGSFIQ